jgi:thiol-disulfide isomerase/thioredoxin
MHSLLSKSRLLPAIALLAAVSCAEAKLKIGDEAPALKVGEWIQGQPVESFAKGTVYVVEFWATWCGPCRQTIPHLDELHEELKNKGIVFIGQDCWERDLTKVKPFVKDMGEKMSYRVATDDTSKDEKGFMAVNWMAAADQNGIPCAFVIGKDTKIAWIGHPAELTAVMLKQVAEGTFDTAKAAEMQAKAEADQMARQEIGKKLGAAFGKKDWDAAKAVLDDAEKEHPELADQLIGIRFQVAQKKEDNAEVVKQAKRMLAAPIGENAQALNQMAWAIGGDMKEPSAEALETAATAASKAVEKTKGEEPAVLDTLARIQFRQGKKEEAIKTQEQAVSKAKDKMKPLLEKTLSAYKDGKLPPSEKLPPSPPTER